MPAREYAQMMWMPMQQSVAANRPVCAQDAMHEHTTLLDVHVLHWAHIGHTRNVLDVALLMHFATIDEGHTQLPGGCYDVMIGGEINGVWLCVQNSKPFNEPSTYFASSLG